MNSRLSRVKDQRKLRIRRVVLFIVFAFVVFIALRVFTGFFKFGTVATEMLFNRGIDLKKTDDRVNVLLLGIGGGVHDGPNLTDTIIFASIDPADKRVTLVSIPRDLWVPDMQAKINTAYAFGEERERGEGLKRTKQIVSKIVGQPVDYVIRIDFDGFVQAIDMVGGLDIVVDRVLDDYEYPVPGYEEETCGRSEEELAELATASSQLEAFPCRYEHLHFDRGRQHMDGETALKFVRSRHGLGAEGSDFARSKRQEKVIQAFKDKVFSLQTFLNPLKIVSLVNVFEDSIHTDIKENEYDDFIKLAQKLENANVQSVILDFGDQNSGRLGLLTNPLDRTAYRGQWVITPKAGDDDFSEIQEYVECYIEGNICDPTPTPVQRQKVVDATKS